MQKIVVNAIRCVKCDKELLNIANTAEYVNTMKYVNTFGEMSIAKYTSNGDKKRKIRLSALNR